MAQMFPSSTNGNVDPIYCNDQQAYNKPFFDDITYNSKHEEHPPLFSFFHLPNTPFSPSYDQFIELYDNNNFLLQQNHDLLIHHHQQQEAISTISNPAAAIFNKNNDTNSEVTNICSKISHNSNSFEQINVLKKRSSKRDRHSKINTAQGLRDRRMRLSLKVAHEFFDLQDKLCFDKASKTVEWLLSQARPAIKKLYATAPSNQMMNNNYSSKSASSTSESGIVEAPPVVAIKGSKSCKGNKQSSSSSSSVKKAKPLRKTAFHPLSKESRDNARAKARERTRKKEWNRRIINESKLCEEAKNNELSQFSRHCSPFEESGSQNNNNNNSSVEISMLTEIEEAPISSSHHDEQQGRSSVTKESITTTDDSLVVMGKWSPSFIFNHLFNTSIPEEQNHQLTDLQVFCKSWEAA